LEQVTAAAEERQHSVHTLTAYRRTWLKLLAWAAARWGADFAGSALVFPRWDGAAILATKRSTLASAVSPIRPRQGPDAMRLCEAQTFRDPDFPRLQTRPGGKATTAEGRKTQGRRVAAAGAGDRAKSAAAVTESDAISS
jgi:hypothetical protein